MSTTVPFTSGAFVSGAQPSSGAATLIRYWPSPSDPTLPPKLACSTRNSEEGPPPTWLADADQTVYFVAYVSRPWPEDCVAPTASTFWAVAGLVTVWSSPLVSDRPSLPAAKTERNCGFSQLYESIWAEL